MIPQTQTAASETEVSGAHARRTAAAQRWPLFLSVFGALAVSLVLWAGIFAVIDLVMRLMNGADAAP